MNLRRGIFNNASSVPWLTLEAGIEGMLGFPIEIFGGVVDRGLLDIVRFKYR